MIKIIAGGKKSSGWVLDAVNEYEKRLKKPFNISWEILDEDKIEKRLEKWDFKPNQVIILADERGKNISSPELSDKLTKIFNSSSEAVIIIGGAFGVSEEVRNKADFIWSFSRLVFPHMLMRIMMVEQIYRAQEISVGGKYHHE
ncbi:MAG: 23S rRNA (pseudouridine(1915)-N(3))-methyltransferase RlmH [Candidatus Saccharibacteria bacterium]|nr:23S rRNA (pseudouridine(1915)-N(3))-methyltransferase RlmH [Candidatus Saccharibacteria bacterium]